MSLIIPTGGVAALNVTSQVVPASSDYSCVFWAKRVGALGGTDYRAFLTQVNGVATYTQWAGLFSEVGLNNVQVNANNGGGPNFSASSITWTNNRLYRLGYTRSGATHNLYFNGVLVGSTTEDISASSFTEQWLGNDTFSDGACEIAYFREWDKFKTLGELELEWESPTAIDAVNLWRDTPLITDGNDISGSGRNWSVVGTATFVSNFGILTLADLPFTDTKTPADRTDEYVYMYKGTLGDHRIIGFYSLADSASGNYNPQTQVYYMVSNTLTTVNSLNASQRAYMVPVDLDVIYYFKIIDGTFANPPGRSITISFVESPDAVPADVNGLLFISDDDSDPFTISTLISPIDGSILKELRDVPKTENGAVSRTNGNMIFTGKTSPILGNVYFFSNVIANDSLTLLSTDTTTLSSAGQSNPPCAVSNNFFYAAQLISGAGVIRIRRWDFDGNLDAQSWNIPIPGGWTTVYAIAVDNEDTVFYYDNFAVTSVLKRWDLVLNAALPDFLTNGVNYRFADLCISSDDTLYIGQSNFIASLYNVLRYNQDGTLLNTYSIDPVKGFLDHFALSELDLISFWVWQHLDDPSDPGRVLYNYDKILISDGSIITSLSNVLNYSQDWSPIVDFGDVPAGRFGANNSCPLIVMLTAVVPPVLGSINVIKIVVPADAVPAFDFTTTNLTPNNFTLHHLEEQLFADLIAGSGYGILETPLAGYTVSYNVSNGSPVDNISVAAGEAVVVTVTNTFSVTPPLAGSGIYKIVLGKRQDTLWLENFTGTRDVKIP